MIVKAVKPLPLLFVSFILFINTFSQSFPDYLERSLTTNKDTLFKGYLSDVSPGEGSINPKLYFVGPGDKIFISIRGIVEQNFNLQINQEGGLYIPKVGLISLLNQSLETAKSSIKEKILDIYKNVEIQISLLDIRKIKVTFIGIVTKPASYVLISNSKLLDLILQSYGLQSNSDLRNIKIIDKDGETKYYDLVSFLRLGNKECNPYLREGDLVIITSIDKTVSIVGAVKNPGTFEFVNNETAAHLLELAGGFLDKARTDTLELTRFLDDYKTIKSFYYSYEDLLNNNIILQRGDRLIIREKPEYLIEQFVTVSGFVKYQGIYKITKDKTTLKELITKDVGGFLDNCSLKDAYVIRTVGSNEKDPELDRLKSIPRADMTDDEYDYLKQKSRTIKGKMVVDFERLFNMNDLSENLILKRGDEIFVPEEKKYVSLVGQVINPGNIIFRPALTIEDYIQLAGGFGWRALKGDIRVIKANTGEWVDEDDVENLEPGDIIWVPEDPPNPRFWEVFQRTLAVFGQVATVIAATVAVIIAVRK
ncbi:MAG: SLBB domain-containing protein [Ignavibacteriales bacterium]|nr:SLBB domain-containing protein [Ignavibacteriales bacterium]